jgi:hypothetical protein
MFVNGSTAIDFVPALCPSGLPSGVDMFVAMRARANSTVVANLSVASRASALSSAFSTSSGAALKTDRSDGTGSLNLLLIID